MTQISAIQQGSESCFTQVYRDFHAKLFHYFLKKTKSDEIATELVQLAFIKLWRFKHTLSEDYSLDTQLFNMARGCLVDYLRQHAIQKAKFIHIDIETDINMLIQPDMNFEISDYFNNAIKSLPPVRKKVFILSRLQGLTYPEIAQQLSISINTVEDHMSKAFRKIKHISSSVRTFFF